MGRPAADPTTRYINVQLSPPDDLEPDLRALWVREFDRFPPGYFVPSDIRAMLLYLEVRRRFDRISAIVDADLAKGVMPKDKTSLIAMAAASREVMRMQGSLRMYPASRATKELFGTLANHPGKQAVKPGETDDWRTMMKQAGSTVTTLPKRRRKP